jgi:hypothetical protein
MTNTTYKFSTPDHDFTLVPNPVVPNLVEVRSENREAIEEFIETLELAGVAEGESFSRLLIEEDMTDQNPFFYTEVSPSTLSLYTSFEFLNYMGVAAPGL